MQPLLITRWRRRVCAAGSAGPSVVKVNKGRKLVAAGTAEDVEILMELEQAPVVDADEAAATDSATPDTETTAKKE